MDAINRSLKDRLLFLEIDDLTANPAPTMKTVYNFIEQSYFHHNFDNVEQVTFEDDIGVHRIEGLHTIRNKVEPVPYCAIDILGVELTKKYSNLEVWRK
jgi:sulfotransferase